MRNILLLYMMCLTTVDPLEENSYLILPGILIGSKTWAYALGGGLAVTVGGFLCAICFYNITDILFLQGGSIPA